MRVVVSGSSGFLGRHLAPHLAARGHKVVRLVRRRAQAPDEIEWHPEAGGLDAGALGAVDAVVHLNGESIGQRWTRGAWERIVRSRVDSTGLLAARLAALPRPPRVLVTASGVGVYGDTGEEVATEATPAGHQRQSRLVLAWEAAAEPARRAGVRVVHMRQGMVLGRDGGALPPLLLPFRLGLGGPFGHGRQWWSWIGIEDAIEAFAFVLERDGLDGPVNVVAPGPVRQRDFARVLGRVLGRPAFMPTPAFVLRLRLGRDAADELLLSGQRVHPGKLLASGFGFRRPGLEDALRAALGRPTRPAP